MVMRALAVCVLVLSVITINAQPICRVYKTFNSAASTGMLQDTISVSDSFPIGSIKLSNIVVGHPNPSSLNMALLHRSGSNDTITTSTLSPSAEGSFIPTTNTANTVSVGQWMLKFTDTLPGAEERLISLTSWTLQLCPSNTPVTATDGQPQIKVDVSKAGVQVEVSKGNTTTDDSPTDRSFKADHTKGIMGLLFPGIKSKPDGVLGAIGVVKEGAQGALDAQVADVFNLVANGSEVYKNFVNKKISDTISAVNAFGTGAQGLMSNKDGVFKIQHKTLLGFIQNLKAALAADTQNKVESVLQTASQLHGLTGKITGDLKSSTGLLTQLVVAAVRNAGKLYLTAEGAAKAHVDGAITAKAKLLEGLLDKIIAALSAAEGSKLTGPAVDFKLKIDQNALKALAATLDKVDDAIKALPTPSQVVGGKVNAVGQLLSALDDGPVIGHLMDKVSAAKSLVKKATEQVVATGGN